MNFKQLSSKLPPEVIKRAWDLYYKYLTPESKDKELQFLRTMDQLLRALEKGLPYG